MNSIQESTNELNAAIRYAETAIASAKQTIESMQFRQDMAKKNHQEQTGREKALDDENIHLQKVVIDLETFVEELRDDKVRLNRKVEALEREVTINTAQANAWKKEYDKIKDQYQGLYDDNVGFKREVANLKECLKIETAALERLREDTPTMPVIPKDVAIAIFREGQRRGYNAESITNSLKGLCEREGFECRIHGIDNNPTNND